MRSDWIKVEKGEPLPIISLPYREDDPVDVYKARYIVAPAEDSILKADIYFDEVFLDFEPASSILLFGSGHSFWPNYIGDRFYGEVYAMDYVPEAGYGLSDKVEGFHCNDILTGGITGKYDYIFTAHTIEHFTRQQLLEVVLPELKKHALKAVVILVPYREHWATEPSHKCLFYEGDELFMLADKYKVIRDGLEFVFWFNV